MLEKLLEYLKRQAEPVPALRLVEEVLGIQGSKAQLAGKIIRAAVADDPRFLETEEGNWLLKSHTIALSRLKEINFIALEFFPISANSLQEVINTTLFRSNDQLISVNIEFKSISAKDITEIQNAIEASKPEMVVISGFSRSRSILEQIYLFSGGKYPDFQIISLRRLAKRLYPRITFSRLYDLQSHLQSVYVDCEEPRLYVNELTELFWTLLEEVKSRGIKSVADFLEFYHPVQQDLDFSNYNFDREYLQNLPQLPGVYLMKDKENKVIYVGKAKNLSHRVNSYFAPGQQKDAKTDMILDRIHSIEYELLGSELEALLREHSLIQQYNPEINRQVKIHPRDVPDLYKKQRILILPAITPDQVSLFLVSDSGTVKQLLVEKSAPDKKFLTEEIGTFFASGKKLILEYSPDGMILLSWLAQHKNTVNWVELDLARDLEDIIRLVLLHISSFNPNAGKTIYI